MEDHNNSDCNIKKAEPLQIFVRLLEGRSVALKFTSPHVYGHSIKHRIYEITKIPTHIQRLISGASQLRDESVISESNTTVHLLLRLLGGKGGFGSLLRGAATKAGQKKTNNFDACRDMSGRRLRHVNAEKRLEEWRAEEEQRKLEKMAEEFIKKKAKKGKKGVGDGEAEKYVERYREESARCVAKVEESVKEACGKRKGAVGEAEAKRLKIWTGKRKLGESDSDDDMDEASSEDDNDEDNEKSIVLNNGNHSDSNKETEESSDSVTGGRRDEEICGGASCESGSDEEKEIIAPQNLESGGCPSECVPDVEKGVADPVIYGEKLTDGTSSSNLREAVVYATETVQAEEECNGPESQILEEVISQRTDGSSLGNGDGNESKPTDAEVNGYSDSKPGVHDDTVFENANVAELEKPLNFDEFSSPAEMEVLGMERLKSELQSHGLKCGGTLQERAARLFLLKSTPLEKLPKKLLAKK